MENSEEKKEFSEESGMTGEKTEQTEKETSGETAETEKTVEDGNPADGGEPSDKKDEAPAKEEGRHEKKKVKKLESRIAELEKKLSESEAALAEKDSKYLLLYAEYDNFRKRSQKEKDGIWTDAYADAIKNLLPVLDNLYRAVGVDDPKGLSEGLKLTVKSYEDALAKMGVEEIKALGEKFDPEKHYAVFHVEDDKYGENEIIEVIGKGYIRDGKVIRYSFVKVAN